MVDQPFFSVIIPTFNRARVLGRAIESVLNQSFKDFELLIVDDGSTDDTQETVCSISDSRVSYRYQTNKGVCTARNLGVTFSRGKYLIFLDSDDSCTERWLEDFYISIKNEDSCIVYCNILKLSATDSKKIINAKDPYRTGYALGSNLSGSWAVKREIFLQAGMYDEKIAFGENNELRLRINKLVQTVSFIPNANLSYFDNALGGSKNNFNKLYSLLYILQKHREYYNGNISTQKRFLRTAAVAAARLTKYRVASIIFLRSLSLDYWDLKSWIQYIFSINKFICKIKWGPNPDN